MWAIRGRHGGVPLRWRPAEYVPALSIGNAESDVERFPSPGGRGGGCVQPAALAGASAKKKGSLDPFRPKGLRAGPVADGAIRAYNGNSPHEEGCGRWIESSLSTHKSGRGSCEDMTRLRIGVYSKPRRGLRKTAQAKNPGESSTSCKWKFMRGTWKGKGDPFGGGSLPQRRNGYPGSVHLSSHVRPEVPLLDVQSVGFRGKKQVQKYLKRTRNPPNRSSVGRLGAERPSRRGPEYRPPTGGKGKGLDGARSKKN